MPLLRRDWGKARWYQSSRDFATERRMKLWRRTGRAAGVATLRALLGIFWGKRFKLGLDFAGALAIAGDPYG
jgi:hypothetical protein